MMVIVGSGLTAFRSGIEPIGITTRYQGNNGAGSDIENDPTFSPGTGQIFKGPYIRNCTNFIPDSIGMKIDGFPAEPGDEDDIGVQGSMSVDSYTQYNQNGIGVSITNGAYAQLVSIFTICCNEAIVTQSGGQCDLTNSNASFGNKGLVSRGISGVNSKSIYRKSANVAIAGSIGVIEGDVSYCVPELIKVMSVILPSKTVGIACAVIPLGPVGESIVISTSLAFW